LALFVVAVAWYLPARIYLCQFNFCYFFPFSQWFIFGLGIVLFFAHKAARPPFSSRSVAIVLDILALSGLWNAFIGTPPGPVHFTAAFAILTFCFAVSQKRSLLRLLVDNTPLRLFGRCCYSIYLFHWLIVSILKSWRTPVLATLGLARASTEARFAVWYFILACTCLGFGMLSFYCIEKPMVTIGRTVIRRLDVVDSQTSVAANRSAC
jgi:peptidoglycan/LPS O-acetylase OafA/YrhL